MKSRESAASLVLEVEQMTLDEMIMGQLKEIRALLGKLQPKSEPSMLPFKVGDCILIRTVTMIQLGRVRTVAPTFLVLDDGGWVADTARFSETLRDGKLNEYEKSTQWIYVSLGSVVDIYPWTHDLPKETK
jgi:hypothetical protein